tara:strand:+ start:2789 stop:3409 length:621 start_codon:yes stop_codon:yes gene_type:complete
MVLPFFTGFLLGLSLIIAIGAQNAFVIRQGILRQHVFYIALFCSIADSLLITLGVVGISYLLNDFINEYSKILFGFAALWLFIYGILKLRSAIRANSTIVSSNSKATSLLNALSIIAIFTFANPHVYLDTMILIGSISQQFIGLNRVFFALGACSASFIWFFGIAYGAKFLSPIMQKPRHWQILDSIIALIMFIIALNLASQGDWL